MHARADRGIRPADKPPPGASPDAIMRRGRGTRSISAFSRGRALCPELGFANSTGDEFGCGDGAEFCRSRRRFVGRVLTGCKRT